MHRVCLAAARLKQYPDAANVYTRAEQYDRAAAILIHTKNFAAIAPLLDKITLPKLHGQYAKVRDRSLFRRGGMTAYRR